MLIGRRHHCRVEDLVALCDEIERTLIALGPQLVWVRQDPVPAKASIDLPTGFKGSLDAGGNLDFTLTSKDSAGNVDAQYVFAGKFKKPLDVLDGGVKYEWIVSGSAHGDVPVETSLCYRTRDVFGVADACAVFGLPTDEPYKFKASSGKVTWELPVPPAAHAGDKLTIRVAASIGASVDYVYVAVRELSQR